MPHSVHVAPAAASVASHSATVPSTSAVPIASSETEAPQQGSSTALRRSERDTGQRSSAGTSASTARSRSPCFAASRALLNVSVSATILAIEPSGIANPVCVEPSAASADATVRSWVRGMPTGARRCTLARNSSSVAGQNWMKCPGLLHLKHT